MLGPAPAAGYLRSDGQHPKYDAPFRARSYWFDKDSSVSWSDAGIVMPSVGVRRRAR